MNARLLQTGLVYARIEEVAQLAPAQHEALLALLWSQVGHGATTLVLDLGWLEWLAPGTPSACLRLLEAAAEVGANLSAVAVVSRSLVLRAVTGAFAIAATLRQQPLEVEVFDDAEEAVAWAREQLPGARRFELAALS